MYLLLHETSTCTGPRWTVRVRAALMVRTFQAFGWDHRAKWKVFGGFSMQVSGIVIAFKSTMDLWVVHERPASPAVSG